MPPNQQITTLRDLERYTQIYKDNLLTFYGLEMCQVSEAVLGINRLLNFYKPKNIIEFGSGRGGLTYLLALYCKLAGGNLYPYEPFSDNKNEKVWKLLEEIGYPLIREDGIHNDKNVSFIKSVIQKPERCLIICDAEKMIEFGIYSDAMKAGDLIMGHDYCPNKEFYEQRVKHNVWSCLELVYSDLKEACDRNQIQEISPDDFWPAVWFSGIKVEKEQYAPKSISGL